MKIIIILLILFTQSAFALELGFRNSFNVGLRFGTEQETQQTAERETNTQLILGTRTSFLESKVDLGETIFTFMAIGFNYQFDNQEVELSISPISLYSKDIGTSISLDIYAHDEKYKNVGLSVGFSF